ncbi:MAG: 5-oxoprolinase subunit C family protein [Mongoliitalea sp.]
MNGPINKSIGFLELVKGGLQCSIQDNGRRRHAQRGVPYSGAMDAFSYSLANHLLENSAQAACLEIGPAPVVFRFQAPSIAVLTGAKGLFLLDGLSIQRNKPFQVEAGSILRVESIERVNWLYLGVKEGFLSLEVLGSRSWSKGITEAVTLKKGMQLPYFSQKPRVNFPTHSRIKEYLTETSELLLYAYRGPDWRLLPAEIQTAIQNNFFELGLRQDRMGFEILGLPPNSLAQLLTAPVYPGTVQLTPSGKMIALMREAQVTGGYPRVLHLEEKSINQLSQLRAGAKIRFHLIDF